MAKKKLYRRPEIRRIKLAPEEAVLTACKVTFGGPAGSAAERTKCNELDACQQLGT